VLKSFTIKEPEFAFPVNLTVRVEELGVFVTVKLRRPTVSRCYHSITWRSPNENWSLRQSFACFQWITWMWWQYSNMLYFFRPSKPYLVQ